MLSSRLLTSSASHSAQSNPLHRIYRLTNRQGSPQGGPCCVSLRKSLCRKNLVQPQTRFFVGQDELSSRARQEPPQGLACVCPKRNVSPFMPQVSVVACNKLNHCVLSTDTPVVGYRSQKIMSHRHPPSGVSVGNVHVYCKLRPTTDTRNLKGRNFFSYVFIYVLREAHRHKY